MVQESDQDSDIDEETLQLDYDEKCDEVVELQNELKAAKIEAAQLRMRLKAAASSGKPNPQVSTVVPNLPAVAVAEPGLRNLENFVAWLAEHVCLDHEVALDVGLEVPIAGYTMQMGRVVQWPLTFPLGTRLFLTAPLECKEQLRDLLTATRQKKKVDPESLQILAALWNLVPGELETITQKAAEPVVMLAHRCSQLGILVASWPTAGALEAFRALCSVDGEPFQVGQRVEVEYDGQWYVGTLHSLTATGKAGVGCDVDGPSVLTIAPVYRVRRHGVPLARSRAVSDQGLQPIYAEPAEHPTSPKTRAASDPGQEPVYAEPGEHPTSPGAAAGEQSVLRRSQSEGQVNSAI